MQKSAIACRKCRAQAQAGVGYTKYLFITPESLIYNAAGELVAPLINKLRRTLVSPRKTAVWGLTSFDPSHPKPSHPKIKR